jgi:hypothetical protein
VRASQKRRLDLKQFVSPSGKVNRATSNRKVSSADSTGVILNSKKRRKRTVLKSRNNRVNLVFDRCVSGKKTSFRVHLDDKNVASRTNLGLKRESCRFTIEWKVMSGGNDRKQQRP